MFCNIRRTSVYAGDLEMGSDLVIFDDIDEICSDSAIALIRGEEMDHPETGEHLILSTYPFVGGFVPLGAKCGDGCWEVAEFHPVPDALGICEPTLVRDIDGALLLAARGTYETGNNQAFLVWRSEDAGSTWEKMIHEKGVRNNRHHAATERRRFALPVDLSRPGKPRGHLQRASGPADGLLCGGGLFRQ